MPTVFNSDECEEDDLQSCFSGGFISQSFRSFGDNGDENVFKKEITKKLQFSNDVLYKNAKTTKGRLK